MLDLIHRKLSPVVLALAALSVTPLSAAPPDVKSLVPRGAAAGSTAEVTITGKVSADWKVWTSRPGVVVEIPA